MRVLSAKPRCSQAASKKRVKADKSGCLISSTAIPYSTQPTASDQKYCTAYIIVSRINSLLQKTTSNRKTIFTDHAGEPPALPGRQPHCPRWSLLYWC